MKGDAATVTSGQTRTAGALTPKHLARKMQGRGISSEKPLKTGMAQESSVVEQAIVRALRDNLESIKRTADELHHAVNDVVSACASNKPTNALPSLLRAQTSAASVAATWGVLSSFVAVSMQKSTGSEMQSQRSDWS